MLEESDVIVRIPDWWKAGRPPRPQVQVRIGEASTGALGKDGLLDFKVDRTLEGEPLSEVEWRSIRESSQGRLSAAETVRQVATMDGTARMDESQLATALSNPVGMR